MSACLGLGPATAAHIYVAVRRWSGLVPHDERVSRAGAGHDCARLGSGVPLDGPRAPRYGFWSGRCVDVDPVHAASQGLFATLAVLRKKR